MLSFSVSLVATYHHGISPVMTQRVKYLHWNLCFANRDVVMHVIFLHENIAFVNNAKESAGTPSDSSTPPLLASLMF